MGNHSVFKLFRQILTKILDEPNQADPIFELSWVKLCPQDTKKGQLGFNWPANSTQIFVK